MDISGLDEYQGLEAQMVRDWMISRGCVRQDGYWRHPREQYHYTDGEYGGLLWEPNPSSSRDIILPALMTRCRLASSLVSGYLDSIGGAR